MSQREDILDLLSGKKMDSQPSFSGLIHVTAEGLQSEGLVFHETHKDPQKMAKAAASTFKLTGIPSATLPLDLCASAEALGAGLNFYEGGEFQFPQVMRALFKSVKDLTTDHTEIITKGRINIICEAIGLVKNNIGKEAVISGVIPGPYTLLLYLCDARNLFNEMKKEPQTVIDALFLLTSFLAEIGTAYKNAGADFITIHDMGGSPAFIGPAKYEQFVFPAEKSLIENLPRPRVLSVCGNVTSSLHLLAQTGADAISLDQTVDLTAARVALKDTLLFGSIDPVEILYQGDDVQVHKSVFRAKEAGVDAIWPGCDLVIQTPIQNIQEMLKM
ncbi:MAG TPA: uroporphyrinogen decarboxylase family protein [Anaerolineales bacterium]|nr:uroporphyrinogen decarboxylase family protein [Anaerolineales bacterium]